MPRLKCERIQILFIYKRMGLSHTMYLRPSNMFFRAEIFTYSHQSSLIARSWYPQHPRDVVIWL